MQLINEISSSQIYSIFQCYAHERPSVIWLLWRHNGDVPVNADTDDLQTNAPLM